MPVKDYSSGLRFAVMLNSTTVQKWQYEVIQNVISISKVNLVLVITPGKEVNSRESFINKLWSYSWQNIVFKKYYQYLFKPLSFQSKDILEITGEAPIVKCQPRKKKKSEQFIKEDIDLIQSYEPDFILKFGFGIIKGEILNCTPLGVWSFHHGDEQKYRGVPPALWEIFNNDSKTGAILQRLTSQLDGGVILRKGLFPTIKHSWSANLDQVISLSKHWPADVCKEIMAQYTFPDEVVGVTTNAPIYKMPGNTTFVAFLIKLFFNKTKFHIDELMKCEIWQTGITKARTADILSELQYFIEPDEVDWLKAGNTDHYYADGFVMKEHERLLLFFEDYSYVKRKGHISHSWFSERDSTFSKPASSLEEQWHLSYPFIFRSDNKIYCIPESKDHENVVLYQLDQTTTQFKKVKTLIPGVSAVDPTMIFHQNHWYLFFTAGHASNVELHIWHAESLDDEFIPHVLNPVKSNISNSRPAGSMFYLDGKLYRPAQDCSKTYGGRIIINEVKILSEESYLEMAISVLEPPVGFEGLHHVSFAGDYMFFDCKMMKFSRANFFNQLKRKLGLNK